MSRASNAARDILRAERRVRAKPSVFTPTQHKYISLVLSGLSGPEIAKELKVSLSNVRIVLGCARKRAGFCATTPELIEFICNRWPSKYPKDEVFPRLHQSWFHTLKAGQNKSLRAAWIVAEFTELKAAMHEMLLELKELNPGYEPSNRVRDLLRGLR